jgi:hypothetical protein
MWWAEYGRLVSAAYRGCARKSGASLPLAEPAAGTGKRAGQHANDTARAPERGATPATARWSRGVGSSTIPLSPQARGDRCVRSRAGGLRRSSARESRGLPNGRRRLASSECARWQACEGRRCRGARARPRDGCLPSPCGSRSDAKDRETAACQPPEGLRREQSLASRARLGGLACLKLPAVRTCSGASVATRGVFGRLDAADSDARERERGGQERDARRRGCEAGEGEAEGGDARGEDTDHSAAVAEPAGGDTDQPGSEVVEDVEGDRDLR